MRRRHRRAANTRRSYATYARSPYLWTLRILAGMWEPVHTQASFNPHRSAEGFLEHLADSGILQRDHRHVRRYAE